jgi:hypothetical protein
VVSFTPRPLYPGVKSPGTHWVGGLVGPKSGLDAVETTYHSLPLLRIERSLDVPSLCTGWQFHIDAWIRLLGYFVIEEFNGIGFEVVSRAGWAVWGSRGQNVRKSWRMAHELLYRNYIWLHRVAIQLHCWHICPCDHRIFSKGSLFMCWASKWELHAVSSA